MLSASNLKIIIIQIQIGFWESQILLVIFPRTDHGKFTLLSLCWDFIHSVETKDRCCFATDRGLVVTGLFSSVVWKIE